MEEHKEEKSTTSDDSLSEEEDDPTIPADDYDGEMTRTSLQDFSIHNGFTRSSLSASLAYMLTAMKIQKHSATLLKMWRENYLKHEQLPVQIEYLSMDSVNIIGTGDVQKQLENVNEFEYKISLVKKIKILQQSTSYIFFLEKFVNVPIPVSLMEQNKIKDSLPELKYRLFLSFFHCPTRQFFGRTSKTEMFSGTNRRIEGGVVKEDIECNLKSFFHTQIVDENVVLVIEIVGYRLYLYFFRYIQALKLKNVVMDAGGIIFEEFGIGWSYLRIFKELCYGRQLEKMSKFDPANPEHLHSDVNDFPINLGTPRALLLMKEPYESDLIPKLGCYGFFKFMRHPALQSCTSLIEQNDICFEKDEIPGFDKNENQTTNFLNPNPSVKTPLTISNISISLPFDFEEKLISILEEHRKREHGNMFDFDNSISIAKRVLFVGCHNSCSFIASPTEANLILDSSNTLTLHGSLSIPQFIDSEMMGVIFELAYFLKVPSQLQLDTTKGKKRVKIRTDVPFKSQRVVVGSILYFPYASDVNQYNTNTNLIHLPMQSGPGRSFIHKQLLYSLPLAQQGKTLINLSCSMHGLHRKNMTTTFGTNSEVIANTKKSSPEPKLEPATPKNAESAITVPSPPEFLVTRLPVDKDAVVNSTSTSAKFNTEKTIPNTRELGEEVISKLSQVIQWKPLPIKPDSSIENLVGLQLELEILGFVVPKKSKQPLPSRIQIKFFFLKEFKQSPIVHLRQKEYQSNLLHVFCDPQDKHDGICFTQTIDHSSLTAEEFNQSIQYLQTQNLILNVEDCDSKLRMGSIFVPGHYLLRTSTQQQYTLEVDLWDSIENYLSSPTLQQQYTTGNKVKVIIRATNTGIASADIYSYSSMKAEFEKNFVAPKQCQAQLLCGLSDNSVDQLTFDDRISKIKQLREEVKHNELVQFVTKQLTEHRWITCTCGETFVFSIDFPYLIGKLLIEVENKQISLIDSKEEQRAAGIYCQYELVQRIHSNLFEVSQFTSPVKLYFKYMSTEQSTTTTTIKIKNSNNSILKYIILKAEVRKPVIINHILNFYTSFGKPFDLNLHFGESTQKLLHKSKHDFLPINFITTDSPQIICDNTIGKSQFKLICEIPNVENEEQVNSFTLYCYESKYKFKLIYTFQVMIYWVPTSVQIAGTMGEVFWASVNVPTNSIVDYSKRTDLKILPDMLLCYTSEAKELKGTYEANLQKNLIPSVLGIGLRPLRQGKLRSSLIHIVDPLNDRLVTRVLAHCSASAPKVTQSISLDIVIGREEKVAIKMYNSSDREVKTYIVGTNVPQYLQCSSSKVVVEPKQTQLLTCTLKPNSEDIFNKEIYVFINKSEDDKTIGCVQFLLNSSG